MSETDQTAVIAFLADPATHGVESVERIDTHASIVFLAGERAYKLKRAVRYSYLDYATVAARERYCRAELALNRRTAPQLYEDVRPVARDAEGRLSLGGAGEAVDWVLVMRRFDQDMLFDRMADRKALTPALMLELAEEIARFHAGAEIDRIGGGYDGMAETVAGNARNLRVAVPDALAVRDVEGLIAATERELARVAKLLDARRRAGKVRHCHGDLHLRN
ncbi:MAG: AAA family ATPase, partial [Dongiaceae bacterium]